MVFFTSLKLLGAHSQVAVLSTRV